MTSIRLRLALPILAALLTLTLAAPAQATTEHTFNPLLSLRGDCSVSKFDEVPDPGLCPMPPGVAGVDHPPKAFEVPCGSAVDRHGDIYVSSVANSSGLTWVNGRIDVFNPKGEYLTTIKDEQGPCKIAVDSKGNLYLKESRTGNVVLFKPPSFPPAKGAQYEGPTIVREFHSSGEVGAEKSCRSQTRSFAVDPSNDHLYATTGCSGLHEYGSAAEGSALIGGVDEVQRLAIDASGGSFKLVFLPRDPYSATADLSAGSSALTSIQGASGTGTLTAGSTAVTAVTTTSGTFKVRRPISGPGLSEGTGTGDLTPGSNIVTNVATDTGAFAVGQTVFAPGVPLAPNVPEGTKITALGAGTLTLSNAVESSEAQVGAPILAATTIEAVTRGTGGEFLRLSLPASASGAAVGLASKGIERGGGLVFGPGLPPYAELISFGPNQIEQGSGVLVGNFGKGDLSAGSNTVTNVATNSGAFAVGQTIFATGVAEGTKITALGAGTLTLSNAATKTLVEQPLSSSAKASTSAAAVPLTVGSRERVEETAALPYNASAASVQAALEALPAIGTGNVSVSGGPGGPGAASPYLIAYEGELANADVPPLGAAGAGLTGSPGTAALTTDTIGSGGAIGEGQAASLTDIAVYGPSHDVYAFGESSTAKPKNARVFILDHSDGHTRCAIDGSQTPQGSFPANNGGVTVDQSSGDLYVEDIGHAVVDQFDSSCHYIGQLEHSFSGEAGAGLAFDAPFPGQPGYDSPNKGELYVATGTTQNKYHLYAFAGVFKPELKLTVSKAGSGQGKVTSSPSGIDCGKTCSAEYEEGRTVTLTATLDEGSVFAGWSGACSGTGACEVTISEAESVTAEFSEEEPSGPVFHKLTISIIGNGEVSADSGSISGCTSAGGPACEGEYEKGAHVTLSETPGEGSLFGGWQTLQCDESTESTCEVTIGSGEEAVTASFQAGQTLKVTSEGPGTITSSPGLISCPLFCEDSFPQGTKVTLKATPAPGAIFVAWKRCDSGGVSGSNCRLAMDEAKAVTAVFASGHLLTVAKAEGSGPGKVKSSPAGISCSFTCLGMSAAFSATTTVRLEATPARHFRFAGFEGACEGTGTCEVSMGEDHEVSALFEEDPRHDLTLTKAGASKGALRSRPAGINCAYACRSITASYHEGAEVLLEVTKVALGSTFTGWSGGGCSGAASTCTVTISEAKEVKAEFK